MRYHMHVYKVAKMFEFDLNAKSGIEARRKALNLTESNELKYYEVKKSDCRFIVMDFIKKE